MKKRSTTYRLNVVDYTIFIVCSIAAAAMLYLFYRDMNSFTIKQTEKPIAKIYFKRNTAQRKFVDNDIWEVLTNSSDVYDGDRIRTSKDSEAYTEFSDGGTQIQLSEKSMVQIFQTKEQKRLDFIGGEIFVASKASDDDKLVIHSGKMDISISNAAEVKIALPEVSEAAAAGACEAEESVVRVEVVSGKVEVTEQAGEGQTENGQAAAEAKPVLVSAGESLTFGTEHGGTESKKPSVAEATSGKSDLPKIPVQVVKEGIEKVVAKNSVTFMHQDFWDSMRNKQRYNYACKVPVADLSEKFKIIPMNSLIELEISGTADKNLRGFAIQVSSGEDNWRRAHSFVWVYPNNGLGIAKDTPFVVKRLVALDYDIVNTDKAEAELCYDPYFVDSPVTIRDFKIKSKILALSGGHGTQSPAGGYSKTLEYGSFGMIKDQWGSGPNEYDWRLYLNADSLLGSSASLPAGAKVKVSVSGVCNKPFDWLRPEIIENANDRWASVFLNNGDYDALAFPKSNCSAGVPFSYTKHCTLYSPMINSNTAMFQLSVGNMDGKVSTPPVFSNLKITVEVE